MLHFFLLFSSLSKLCIFYWLGEAKLTIDVGSNAPLKPAHLDTFDTNFNRGIERIIDIWQSYFT